LLLPFAADRLNTRLCSTGFDDVGVTKAGEMERADALDAVMESTSSNLDILLSTIMVLQLVDFKRCVEKFWYV